MKKRYFVHARRATLIITIKKSSKFFISFRCINKFNNFIKTHKDETEFMSNNNVKNKIQCKDGDVSYVG